MSDGLDSRTSPTLLGRLRLLPLQDQAWEEFVVRYGPRIHRWCAIWCGRRGLQEEDAKDATQVVILKLLTAMKKFEYDPKLSFRGYLKVVVRNTCSSIAVQQGKGGRPGGEAIQELLETTEARDDLCEQLTDECLMELRQEVLGRVRIECPPRAWEAWSIREKENLTSQAIANRMEVAVATVDGYVSRVNERIEELTTALDPR